MDISRVQRGERIAIYGGLALAIGLFLPWYDVHTASELSVGTHSGWESHPTMRWLLLAASIAPLILAWIIANDHALSWPRGQMTSVVAIAAFGLVGYHGVIDRPGDVEISLKFGWFVALVGSIVMLVGANMRVSQTEIKRKPPGTL
jgi:archaellum biogenesis protein FlaJ (TadC family)